MSETGAGLCIGLGEGASSIERTGAEILAEALQAGGQSVEIGDAQSARRPDVLIGAPGSSATVASLADTWKIAELGEEGFAVGRLNTNAPALVVAGGGPRGVLYGCAAAAERCRLGERLADIKLRERPVLAERNLWTWNGPRKKKDALFSIDRMLHAPDEPAFQALGRYLAGARINALTLWPAPEARPDIGPGSEDDAMLDAYRVLTRFLRERYGVETYIFMWYEIERGVPTPIHGWPICPFDKRVIDHWQERIGRFVRNVPDLRGIVMAGAGGDWVRGPWECQCEECRKHTDRELLIRAMRMIGEPWAAAGGRIIWKAVTDRPTLVKSEVEHFANLDDALPPYVRVAHKTFYKDFRPTHPLQPIFHAHADDPPGVRPYLCEFQIYGEYRGGTAFPCVMIDRWADVFPLLARKHYAGAIGVCSFAGADEWDHPLNMANWYAFGRYAWNPLTPPDEIYRDWAVQTFGAEAAPAVIDICRTTYPAAMKMMFFQGVMTQNHSKLPTIDHELESSLIGPWHDIPRAADGYMGRAHDVSMYPPDVAERIRNDPKLQLWAHRVRITPELCDEGVAEKHEAWRLVRQMVERWNAIPHAGWEDLHRRVAEQFRRNCVDAEVWYEDIRLYFDYKAGRLTKSDLQRRLDDLKARFDPAAGSELISETFDRFLGEWKRLLHGYKKRFSMPGAYQNPAGEYFLPGLKDE